jgi:hypothetical protein
MSMGYDIGASFAGSSSAASSLNSPFGVTGGGGSYAGTGGRTGLDTKTLLILAGAGVALVLLALTLFRRRR